MWKKLRFRTVQRNRKSFLWMQDWGWMVSLHLICGICSSKFFMGTRIRVFQNLETLINVKFVHHFTQFKNESNLREWSMTWSKLALPDNEICFQKLQSSSWFVIRSNQLGLKIQIKNIDTKNQLADLPTKGNFTRDEWNHLLCLFSNRLFSSSDGSEVMSKRTQKDSGEDDDIGLSMQRKDSWCATF